VPYKYLHAKTAPCMRDMPEILIVAHLVINLFSIMEPEGSLQCL
jgi:hypothetical protein